MRIHEEVYQRWFRAIRHLNYWMSREREIGNYKFNARTI